MGAEAVHTFCRICEPQCGLVVQVENNRVVDVSGDPEHPLSRGFACGKGVAMRELQHDPDRVLQPLRRSGGPGAFEPVAWDDAITDIGNRLGRVIESQGSDAVAVYGGNPRAFSFGHGTAVSMFVRGIGTPHLYGPMAQDAGARFAATALLYGSPALLLIPDLPRTQFLLMLGSNPFVSHGSIICDPRIADTLRGIRDRGGEVVVVDPRRSETARAFRHLAINAGTDPWFLLSLLQVIIGEDLVDHAFLNDYTRAYDDLARVVARFPPEATAAVTAIDPGITREVAIELAQADAAVVYGRTGTCTQRFGTLTNYLQDLINIVTGNLDRPGGWVFAWSPMGFEEMTRLAHRDSYGGTRTRIGNLPDVMTQLPASVLAAEITTPGPGQIRALLTTAGNPVLSVPDAVALEAALQQLELHVSLDLYVNETNRWADYVLPVPTFLERSDVHLMGCESIAPFIQVTDAVITPAPSVREEWEVLRDIANAIGRPEAALPATPREMVDGLLARVGLSWSTLETEHPRGMSFGDRQRTGVLPEKIGHADGRIPLVDPEILVEVSRLDAEPQDPAFPFRLVGLREARTHNSWMHNAPMLTRGRRRPQPGVRIHPDDAAALGIADGDSVVIRSKTGEVEVPATVSDEMTPGNVAYPHGWGHGGGWEIANGAGGVNINRLSSAAPEDLERLAAMAILNGVAVSIERAVTTGRTS